MNATESLTDNRIEITHGCATIRVEPEDIESIEDHDTPGKTWVKVKSLGRTFPCDKTREQLNLEMLKK